MLQALAILFLVAAAIGHTVFWVALVNRVHAVAWNRKIIDGLTALCGVMLLVVPLYVAWTFWNYGFQLPHANAPGRLQATWIALTPLVFLAFFAAWQHWFARRRDRPHATVVTNHTEQIDMSQWTDEPLTAPGIPTLLARVPYNQVTCPAFQQKRLVIPNLAARDAGVKLAHLTDLHMSGRITRIYFEQIVDRVNSWRPDLVALTGDIVERPKCLDWIEDTLARVRATHGKFFVLGNHDQHVDTDELRQRLVAAGWMDLGSTCYEVSVGQTSIVLGGNELPWFGPPANFSEYSHRDEQGLPLKVLLAHTPDQFAWAQDQDVDLILAGHCHGGQVRFPVVGAVLAPSLHGTRYSDGVFREGSTILHVSRGTSGLAPFRFNCPPEVSLLTLVSGN